MSLSFTSTKGRYALLIMADLAKAQQTKGDGWESLGEVSEHTGLSRKYLEQIISVLHKAHMVDSKRGKIGGYRLARQAKTYSLGEILRVAEGGSLAPVACLDCSQDMRCDHAHSCPTLPIWQELGQLISQFLDSKHLDELLG